MKILCISDTHVDRGTGKLPQAVYDAARGVDLIIHAGDHVCMDVVEELKGYAPVEAVSGNMDGWEVASRLPDRKIIEAGRFRIGITHGAGDVPSIKERVLRLFKDDKVDSIVFGHSHSPVVERRGDVLLVNPGSPLDTRFAKFNSYAVISAGEELTAEIVRLN